MSFNNNLKSRKLKGLTDEYCLAIMRHKVKSILKQNQILGELRLLDYNIVLLPAAMAIFARKHLPTYVVRHVAVRHLLEAVVKYEVCRPHVTYDKVGVTERRSRQQVGPLQPCLAARWSAVHLPCRHHVRF